MAKEVDRFWTVGAGRIDRFRFEMVAPNDLDKHLGWLEGVTQMKLTFGWDTETKVSGSLDVLSAKFVTGCVVRVHYEPRLGTEERPRVLCTCWATADSMSFDKGRYTGSLTLSSMLSRYTDDKLEAAFTIGKNKSFKAELKRLIGLVGGSYSFSSDVKDKTCGKAVTFEAGKAPMEVVKHVASALGARVGVSAKGVMTFEPNTAAAKKTCELVLPKGGYSVVGSEIKFSDNVASIPNRVAYRCEASWKQRVYVRDKKGNRVKYTSGSNKGKYKTKLEKKTQVVVGRAQVAQSSPAHYSSRGRWVTEVFTMKKDLGSTPKSLEQKLADLQKTMNEKAAAKLANVAVRRRHYELECLFLPVGIGQVVEFERTASGISLHVQAMATDIELTATQKGVRMGLTLRHVRNV